MGVLKLHFTSSKADMHLLSRRLTIHSDRTLSASRQSNFCDGTKKYFSVLTNENILLASLLSTGKCQCPEFSGMSLSQTLFWWKFSGQMIDQTEEYCTDIVFLLQKRRDTFDAEVRLAHGTMRPTSLMKLPNRFVLVLKPFIIDVKVSILNFF